MFMILVDDADDDFSRNIKYRDLSFIEKVVLTVCVCVCLCVFGDSS